MLPRTAKVHEEAIWNGLRPATANLGWTAKDCAGGSGAQAGEGPSRAQKDPLRGPTSRAQTNPCLAGATRATVT